MNGDWLGLAGVTCVVSGSGSGIGRAIAAQIGAVGGQVVVLDLDGEKAADSAAAIVKTGGKAISVRADIANPASVEEAARVAEKAFGPCKVLVNNAALVRNGALADLSINDWNAVLSVNLTGFFISSQVFGRQMMAGGGGSIVHIASMSGTYPQPTSGAYSVSKAGVLMLSKNLALEWGDKGIRSNVVSPAMVLTPMSEVIYKDQAVKAKRESIVPVRRIGMPDDIAEAVLFLASGRSSYVSGQEILVDGGWSSALLAMVPRPGFDQPKKA